MTLTAIFYVCYFKSDNIYSYDRFTGDARVFLDVLCLSAYFSVCVSIKSIWTHFVSIFKKFIVKVFKNEINSNEEFISFIFTVFNSTIISFQLERSNSSHVFLSSTDLNSEGLYGCEVSGEAPSFSTAKSEDEMRVYSKLCHVYKLLIFICRRWIPLHLSHLNLGCKELTVFEYIRKEINA